MVQVQFSIRELQKYRGRPSRRKGFLYIRPNLNKIQPREEVDVDRPVNLMTSDASSAGTSMHAYAQMSQRQAAALRPHVSFSDHNQRR